MVKTCDPVTKYLQTIGLDITQALRLVEHEMNILAADRSKFEQNFQCAKEFRQQVQQLIDDDENADFDIVLEENLPTSAISRKKRRFSTNKESMRQLQIHLKTSESMFICLSLIV